jgi:protoporphyrinogen oxidase
MHSNSQERWAIVGGGFLGMTLALRLAQRGKAVTLYESAPSLGGVASAWQLADVIWDRHYHVTLSSDSCLRSLLRELKLEDRICWQKAGTGFYIDSQLHSISNALEFLRFPPLNLVDKLRLGATILHASRIRDWKTLEKIPVAHWLEKWSGPNVLKKIWLPLLRAKLGDNYRQASAAFIWATIARMYAARRTKTKTELFGYVTGGYARIIEQFSEVLRQEGVQSRLGQRVKAVTSTRFGSIKVEATNGASGIFDQVVVTTAAPLAVRLCPELSPREIRRLQAIKYQGIICASLLLKHSLSGFYITNIADSRIPFTAVIEITSLVDRSHFAGRSLVYLPKYVSSDSPSFNLTDDAIREAFLPALEKMHPRFRASDVECFKVSRVRYLLPIPTLRYSDHLPEVATSVPGLHLLNSAQIVNGTLNVNETVRLAESAANKFVTQIPPPKPIDYALAAAHR